MNAKSELLKRLVALMLVLSVLLSSLPFGLDSAAAATSDIGGFLFAWTGSKSISNGPTGHGYAAIDIVRTGTDPEHFTILAPKDGEVVALNHNSSYGGTCAGAVFAANYIVLGHGPVRINGSFKRFDHYSLYLHLNENSIPFSLQVGSRVRMGDVIGIAGNTGFWQSNRPINDPDRGTHLHMEVSMDPPDMIAGPVYECDNSVGVVPLSPRSIPNFYSRVGFGFEETANNWPPSNPLQSSYNWNGIQVQACNPFLSAAILYNHINYGGECLVVPLNQDYVVPTGFHVSSIYVNQAYVKDKYYLWTSKAPNPIPGDTKNFAESIPNLLTYNWNDQIYKVRFQYDDLFDPFPGVGGYVWQNQNPSWLLEFAKSESSPLDVQFHVKVEWTSEFSAVRLCFNGTNCQEHATPITEFNYTWNTYGWSEGYHTVSVQYRRQSDGGSWDTALKHEEDFYLSPNRAGIAPCGTSGDGVTLQSGSDCVFLTQSRGELAEIGWGDRSDLQVTVYGDLEAWVYEAPHYFGAPRLVKSGQSVNVGGNISSVDLKPLREPPPRLPDSSLTDVEYAVALYHLDEGAGLTINDETGNYSGTAGSAITWVEGRFGPAIDFTSLQSGQALKFGAFNYDKITVEAWVKLAGTNQDATIAAQVGDGGNTGPNKWMFRVNGNRPSVEVWSSTGSTIFESAVTLQPNVWYFLMATLDSVNDDVKIYVNNEEVGSHPQNVVDFWQSGATTFEIGARGNIYYFNGAIDDVRISSELRKPVYLSLDAFVSNPITREVTAVASWEGAAGYIQQLRWDTENNYGIWGENYNHYTHSFEYSTSGTKTVTLTVLGSDQLGYVLTKDVNLVNFTCGTGADFEGIVLFDYMDCAWTNSSDFVQLFEPGLYNLEYFNFNDKATSIHFPQDGSMSARLYEDSDGTGQSICRTVYDMWNMAEDLWPDNSPMDNSVSSIEIFPNDTCTPPPQMEMTPFILNPHGEIRLDVSWLGAHETWQMIDWGDESDYGMYGSSGSQSPTHWFPGPGTYTVTFTVINAAPDYEPYTLVEEITINEYACGSSVIQAGIVFYRFSDCAYRDSSDYEQFIFPTGTFDLDGLNDAAVSLHVPDGRSVKLFEGAGQTGYAYCASGDMWYMYSVNWPNTSEPIGGSVSSIKLYDNATCTD